MIVIIACSFLITSLLGDTSPICVLVLTTMWVLVFVGRGSGEQETHKKLLISIVKFSNLVVYLQIESYTCD